MRFLSQQDSASFHTSLIQVIDTQRNETLTKDHSRRAEGSINQSVGTCSTSSTSAFHMAEALHQIRFSQRQRGNHQIIHRYFCKKRDFSFVRCMKLQKIIIFLLFAIIFMMGIAYLTEDHDPSTYAPKQDLYKIIHKLFPKGLTAEEISMSEIRGRLKGSRLNLPFYKALIEPDPICPDPSLIGRLQDRGMTVVFLVKTTHSRFQTRAVIRQTWGSTKCNTAVGLVSEVFFLLGTLGQDSEVNRRLQNELMTEHSKNLDILQFDFVDNYYNNTYKVMSALWYAARRFSCYKFVILVDDDFLLHPANLMQILEGVTEMHYPIYIAGRVLNAMPPIRSLFSKWYISHSEYSPKVYPRYPTGGTVVISLPMVRLMAIGMAYTDYIVFDDVLMGMVLLTLGISPIHLSYVTMDRQRIFETDNQIISSHGFSRAVELANAWDLIKSTACSRQHRRL